MASEVHLSKAQRLMIIIGISFCFFAAEISVGFYTHSLALIADAFHYLNDLVGFAVALVAAKISERSTAPKELSFGWQRANLLGAFFNGVFLLALGVSIFLQSLERFIAIEVVENPMLVLIIGCVGFALNLISAAFLHEHNHNVKTIISGDLSSAEMKDQTTAHNQHRHETNPQSGQIESSRDLGMMGVLLHVLGDAANNLGVILAASIIWKLDSEARYYADPAVSMAISFMILFTSLPLVRKTGMILMESSPSGVDPDDVRHDVEQIDGVKSIHELHIWRLNQQKSLASAHIVVNDQMLSDFIKLAKTTNECFHAYGIHSTTLQPELVFAGSSDPHPSVINSEGRDIGSSGGQNPGAVVLSCTLGCEANNNHEV